MKGERILKAMGERLDQIQRYIDEGGTFCPYCDDDQLSQGPATFNAGAALQPVTCLTCGKSWTNCYILGELILLDGEPLAKGGSVNSL